jgi:hypothetical protein
MSNFVTFYMLFQSTIWAAPPPMQEHSVPVALARCDPQEAAMIKSTRDKIDAMLARESEPELAPGAPAGVGMCRAAGSDRWPLGFKSNPADLVSFLKGLFFVSPGHYRVIVFILQDLPFTQTSKEVSGEDAKAWLREGANILPREIAGRPFGNGTCTALIYEFESDGSAAKIVESSVTGKQHLERAGLLAALDSAN